MSKQKTPACSIYYRDCPGKNDPRLLSTYCYDIKKCTHCPQRGGDDIYNNQKNTPTQPPKPNDPFAYNNSNAENQDSESGLKKAARIISLIFMKLIQLILLPFKLVVSLFKKIVTSDLDMGSKIFFIVIIVGFLIMGICAVFGLNNPLS